jgi:hypothetical protein
MLLGAKTKIEVYSARVHSGTGHGPATSSNSDEQRIEISMTVALNKEPIERVGGGVPRFETPTRSREN